MERLASTKVEWLRVGVWSHFSLLFCKFLGSIFENGGDWFRRDKIVVKLHVEIPEFSLIIRIFIHADYGYMATA